MVVNPWSLPATQRADTVMNAQIVRPSGILLLCILTACTSPNSSSDGTGPTTVRASTARAERQPSNRDRQASRLVEPVRVGTNFVPSESFADQLAVRAVHASPELASSWDGLFGRKSLGADAIDRLQLRIIGTPGSLSLDWLGAELQEAARELDELAACIAEEEDPWRLAATARALSSVRTTDFVSASGFRASDVAEGMHRISLQLESQAETDGRPDWEWFHAAWRTLASSVPHRRNVNEVLAAQIVRSTEVTDPLLLKSRASAEVVALSQAVLARAEAVQIVRDFVKERGSWERLGSFQDSFTGPLDAPSFMWDLATDGIASASATRFSTAVASPADMEALSIAIVRPFEFWPDRVVRRIYVECPVPVAIWNADQPEIATTDLKLASYAAATEDVINAAVETLDMFWLAIECSVAAYGVAFAPVTGGASLVVTILAGSAAVTQLTFAGLDATDKETRGATMVCALHDSLARRSFGFPPSDYKVGGFSIRGSLHSGASIADEAEEQLTAVRRAIVDSVEVVHE